MKCYVSTARRVINFRCLLGPRLNPRVACSAVRWTGSSSQATDGGVKSKEQQNTNERFGEAHDQTTPSVGAPIDKSITTGDESSSVTMPDLSQLPPPSVVTKGPPNMVLQRAPAHPDAGGNYFPVSSDTASKAVESRESKLFTMEEYISKEQKEEFAGRSLKQDLMDATDNPKWLLWSLFFMAAGSGYVVMCVRLRKEQRRFDPKLRAVHTLDVDGGPTVGGPFVLEDLDGNTVTDADFKGKWTYLYFGFTNCPDVCPQEMGKLTRVISALDKKVGEANWQPVFITIDPKRDTAKVMKEYLADFHPRIMGLRGTPEQVEKAAREYRVYYAVPDEYAPDNPDYLIDHSIVMYLMDPEGKFSDYTTKEFTWFESYSKLLRRIIDYERLKKPEAADFNEDIANLHSFSSKTDMNRMKRFAAGDYKA